MREFLKTLGENYRILEIEEEVSTYLQICEIMRKYPKEALIFHNIRETNMKIVSGICNTREKIAKAMGVDVSGIIQRIVEATENPVPIDRYQDAKNFFEVSKKT